VNDLDMPDLIRQSCNGQRQQHQQNGMTDLQQHGVSSIVSFGCLGLFLTDNPVKKGQEPVHQA